MSSRPVESPAQRPAAAVARLRAAIDELAQAGLWPVPREELGALTADLERESRRLAGQALRLVAEADACGQPAREGCGSTAAWVRKHTLVTPGEARRRADLAVPHGEPAHVDRGWAHPVQCAKR